MHFIQIGSLKKQEIHEIFRLTDKLIDNTAPLLSGKHFALFFPESSIRTRLSFEIGIKSLGGSCTLFPPETLDKREALYDVSSYIGNWADAVIVRHKDYVKVKELSKNTKVAVINAMTSYNHPCEILSDVYSMRRLRSDYDKLTYTFVGGDGNIINSWKAVGQVLDLKINHVSLPEYRIGANNKNYQFTSELEGVLKGTDVVLTDPLPSALRNASYYNKYQITFERMKCCKEGALLNPCPPFYRGEEVSQDVIDSEYFVGHAFKKHLLYVQQAIILYCLNIKMDDKY